jgi:FlaA1/EpsC-like NDP-sugar epimerase
MGEPVRIRDLAQNMIQLAGLSVRSADNPEGDIEIAVTGARPGEKLFEELLYDPRQALTTRHPKVMRARMGEQRLGEVAGALAALAAAIEAADEAALRRLLFAFIKDGEPVQPAVTETA